jgi:signal peptidase
MADRLGGRVDRGTVTTLLNLFAVLVILAGIATFAVFAVPQLVGAERSYVVLSGSMQPTMEPGDVILVDAVEIEAVESGDIVTFRESANSVTTHRVVEKVESDGGTALRTKGDDNEEPDIGLVRSDALVGRVMTLGGTPIVFPYVGHAIETARTQLGVYALVLVPLSLFVLNELYVRLPSGGSDAGTPPDPLASADGRLAMSVRAHAVAEGNPGLADAVPSAPAHEEPAHEPALDPDVETLVPLRLTLPMAVLAVLVPYTGWMTFQHESVVGAMVFAGGAVFLALLGYVHLRRYRSNGRGQPAGALTAGEVSLALVGLLAMVATSAWYTLAFESVLSAMLATGSALSLVLLVTVRVQLWWGARRSPESTLDPSRPPSDARRGEEGV